MATATNMTAGEAAHFGHGPKRDKVTGLRCWGTPKQGGRVVSACEWTFTAECECGYRISVDQRNARGYRAEVA